jgi:hypothetical protein
MPAPTPIQIRYGQAGIAPLAAAVGSSVGGVVAARRQDDDQRFHQQLVLANMARNAPTSPFALQQAAGYNPRYAAQRGGSVTSTEGRMRSPLQIARDEAALEGQQLRNEKLRGGMAGGSLVPADGPLGGGGGVGGGATLIGHGAQAGQEWAFDPQTGTVQESLRGRNGEAYPVGGPQGGRGVFNRDEQEEMVTPDVRAQLDYLRTIEGQIPEENRQGLMIAARAGTLKMDQLIDNARQFLPRNSTRMTATDRAADRLQAEAQELAQILQMDGKDQAYYARRRFNMQDPDIYTDEDAIQALQSRGRQVTALLKPVQNSGGATPTGGNPVKVNTPEEARALPSGTYIQTPDGRIMRVP